MASISEITGAVKGSLLQGNGNAVISNLCTDSRKIIFPESSLFFALKTNRRNGQQFIPEVYEKGVRAFVISDEINVADFPSAAFIRVNDCLQALQDLAAFHRNRFSYPVIGITGSNGKTIIKEWLYHLLQGEYNIVRSPRSYNSQIGVPLSAWQMGEQNNLGIFEAGISEKNEMQQLQKVILPTIGIFSNIGDAHAEGFSGIEEKIQEKLKLFADTKTIIYCKDHELISKAVEELKDIEQVSWGKDQSAEIRITNINKQSTGTTINLVYKNNTYSFSIPFINDAWIENTMHCIATCLFLGVKTAHIQSGLSSLKPVAMRLELKQGINNCSIINDSYSADFHSLEIALDFLLQQQQHPKRAIILSDIMQSGKNADELYSAVARLLHEKKINRLVAVGEQVSAHRQLFEKYTEIESHFYPSIETLEHDLARLHFKEESILIKGARVFELERIEKLLEQKVHQTVLEINLSALAHNLKEYQRMLNPSTKIMVMVKAFGYGSGSYEIANLLQFHKCDYLAVAYADEGVELRKAGISLPIMVMNPEETAFDLLLDHNLEPEIFSFGLFKQFDEFIRNEGLQNFPVHIKLDTGMHRLGFMPSEIERLCHELKKTSSFKIQSVFSHLAASEDKKQDEFTQQQDYHFSKACQQIQAACGYTFLKHIANSAAIFRHPSMQYDMVRLGIGIYGVDSAATGKINLKEVSVLKTTIAQIKELKKGDTVGYGRKSFLQRDSVIATVRIGYADGYSRLLGNGNGRMIVNDKMATVTGNICMDMTMIDITDIPGVKEGDEVIVFGKQLPIQNLASWAGTIPYEIMTSISQRVKRLYFEE